MKSAIGSRCSYCKQPWSRVDDGASFRPRISGRSHHHNPLLRRVESSDGRRIPPEIGFQVGADGDGDDVDSVSDGIVEGFKHSGAGAAFFVACPVAGDPRGRVSPTRRALGQAVVVGVGNARPARHGRGVRPVAAEVPRGKGGLSRVVDSGADQLPVAVGTVEIGGFLADSFPFRRDLAHATVVEAR